MPYNEGSHGVKSLVAILKTKEIYFHREHGIRTTQYGAYKISDFYARWTDFIGDGGGLQYIDLWRRQDWKALVLLRASFDQNLQNQGKYRRGKN